ncbi:uncharacterized protein [Elaeis guineensis]|uniref:Uncharacterized protein LOC105050993 isoform X2 n=1 Tax=Elaeis guineensis var. tenera TaxID=51953 RepID=A0A6I9RNZ6_ELAGV|nr:uncharacterized protein LOC105050993 isoform X2 [Elaeis guineensis]
MTDESFGRASFPEPDRGASVSKMALAARIRPLHPLLFLGFVSSPSQSPRQKQSPGQKNRKMASWACSKCTFLNPASQKYTCEICFSPSAASPSSPSSSSSSSIRWSCRACTFSNPSGAASCEMCGGTRTAPSSAFLDLDLEPDELSNPSIGSVFLPLQRCGSKRRGPAPAESDRRDEKVARKDVVSSPVSDLEVSRRMEALGNLIQQHSPDFICFQEVTPNIYGIFQNANWWKEYKCSVAQKVAAESPYFCMQMSRLPVKAFRCKPFTNSIMGRELCLADIDAGGGTKLVIATSHLESPCPAPPRWDQMYSKERVAQAKESLNLLKDSPNVIFGGDMNWDDKLDGAFPLPDGWIDAWMELRPGESGWTYDTKANQMLSGNRKLQKRLDRFICSLQDFKLDSIQMVGMEAIPGLTYCKERKVKKEFQKLVLPVLPSDHYGLLLNISRS